MYSPKFTWTRLILSCSLVALSRSAVASFLVEKIRLVSSYETSNVYFLLVHPGHAHDITRRDFPAPMARAVVIVCVPRVQLSIAYFQFCRVYCLASFVFFEAGAVQTSSCRPSPSSESPDASLWPSLALFLGVFWPDDMCPGAMTCSLHRE